MRGLKIKGDSPRWTNDGIDIDCCSRVTVSDCIIDVGDDALTVRANKEPLLHKEGRSENITVTNCVLRSSRDYRVRVGVGAGVICGCTFSNLDIEAPNAGGIGIMSKWSSDSKYATNIERIIFSCCNVSARKAFDVYISPDDAPLSQPCFIRNVTFSHMLLTMSEGSRFSGTKDVPLKNIYFSDITVESNIDGVVFNIADAENITFDGLRIISESEDVSLSCCGNVTVNGRRLED